MGEAEQILRREMPPEQAERNLRWLQDRGSQRTPDGTRTWTSLQGG